METDFKFSSKTDLVKIFTISFCFFIASIAYSQKSSNIILLSDNAGWGDLGLYGGGEGRGAATPNIDKMAKEGIQFWSLL